MSLYIHTVRQGLTLCFLKCNYTGTYRHKLCTIEIYCVATPLSHFRVIDTIVTFFSDFIIMVQAGEAMLNLYLKKFCDFCNYCNFFSLFPYFTGFFNSTFL